VWGWALCAATRKRRSREVYGKPESKENRK
jgi:hypothetical protein